MTQINPEAPYMPTTDRIEGELALTGGITIRAEFAARFMAAYISNSITPMKELPGCAMLAIHAADLLIAELNKKL